MEADKVQKKYKHQTENQNKKNKDKSSLGAQRPQPASKAKKFAPY